MTDPDEQARLEREKYEKVWDFPEYRNVSPGMAEVERAMKRMNPEQGDTLYDFGAGPGRATKWFRDRGLEVTAVDHAANALETDVDFRQACLWDMSHLVPHDYGFCCDVLEHIPTDRVGDVIAEIAEKVRVGCWFRIATRKDVMGDRTVGAPLHLTVKPHEWWFDRILKVFLPVYEISNDGKDSVFWACKD